MATQSTQSDPRPRDWVYPGQDRASEEQVIDLDAERPRAKHRPKH